MYIPDSFYKFHSPVDTVRTTSTLLARAIEVDSDIQNNWDKCMDRTWCKWVVIVLIIIAGMLVFWILATIVRCVCMGMECATAMLCCCCNCCRCCSDRGRRDQYRSGNESYVATHPGQLAQPTVVNNYHYGPDEPQYLGIDENGHHTGVFKGNQGYVPVNNTANGAMEMNVIPPSSVLYADTSYAPNKTTPHDNTYDAGHTHYPNYETPPYTQNAYSNSYR